MKKIIVSLLVVMVLLSVVGIGVVVQTKAISKAINFFIVHLLLL